MKGSGVTPILLTFVHGVQLVLYRYKINQLDDQLCDIVLKLEFKVV